MAVGFEKMAPGSLENMKQAVDDRAVSTDKHIQVIADTYGLVPAPITAQMFGNAGREHMEKYGGRDLERNSSKSRFQALNASISLKLATKTTCIPCTIRKIIYRKTSIYAPFIIRPRAI
jgi:hypothetical protein